MQMLYLIGVPGSGKSTSLKEAIGDVPREEIAAPAPARTFYKSGEAVVSGVQIGITRNGFSGTDALPMNAITSVSEWLEKLRPSVVVAEGDRLAGDKFFTFVKGLGYDLTVAFLDIAPETAARRRKERAAALGVKEQNPVWVKGRETKVAKLAGKWTPPAWWLSGDRPLAEVVESLRKHPVVQAIRGNR